MQPGHFQIVDDRHADLDLGNPLVTQHPFGHLEQTVLTERTRTGSVDHVDPPASSRTRSSLVTHTHAVRCSG